MALSLGEFKQLMEEQGLPDSTEISLLFSLPEDQMEGTSFSVAEVHVADTEDGPILILTSCITDPAALN